jgi:hypothetical protein
MFSGKMTIATLLLLLSTACPYLLVTVTGNPECTVEQKKKILLHCIAFVERGTPNIRVHPQSVCCDKVREVKNMAMSCIATLLTPEEKKTYDVFRLLGLKSICQRKLKKSLIIFLPIYLLTS